MPGATMRISCAIFIFFCVQFSFANDANLIKPPASYAKKVREIPRPTAEVIENDTYSPDVGRLVQKLQELRDEDVDRFEIVVRGFGVYMAEKRVSNPELERHINKIVNATSTLDSGIGSVWIDILAKEFAGKSLKAGESAIVHMTTSQRIIDAVKLRFPVLNAAACVVTVEGNCSDTCWNDSCEPFTSTKKATRAGYYYGCADYWLGFFYDPRYYDGYTWEYYDYYDYSWRYADVYSSNYSCFASGYDSGWYDDLGECYFLGY